jgi:hypothetical protein
MRSNTIQCGAMAPSVPPDITRQILAASSLGRKRWNNRLKSRFAKPRLKSLTRPLPSVFARTAMTPWGLIRPAAIAVSIPETSSGAAAEIRWTLAIGMPLPAGFR